MSTRWTITLEGRLPIKTDDIQFIFQDISDSISKTLKPLIFEKLAKQIKQNDHYRVYENVKSIVNNEGNELPINECTMLLFSEKTGSKGGIMFLQLESSNLLPIAVWPDAFANTILRQPDQLFIKVVEVLEEPEKFEDVRLILPIQLRQDPKKAPDQIIWSVELEGEQPGPEGDWVLEFIDLKYGLERPRQIMPGMILRLLKVGENQDHYLLLKQIKKITSNMNESLPIDKALIILAESKENDLMFHFLLFQNKKGEIELIGLWPPQFVTLYRKNEKAAVILLGKLIEQPDLFKNVAVFTPIDLEQAVPKATSAIWSPIYKTEVKEGTHDGIQFIDCTTQLKFISVLPKFFHKLFDNMRQFDHYQHFAEITGFQLDSKDKLASQDFAFIFAKTKKGDVRGLLFKKTQQDSYILQGIYPEEFLEATVQDDTTLFTFIEDVAKNPDLYQEVRIAPPS
ncbi:MAG: hypothetical protein ACTSRS_17510 [Candidatus Helarchaeota archaeon]